MFTLTPHRPCEIRSAATDRRSRRGTLSGRGARFLVGLGRPNRLRSRYLIRGAPAAPAPSALAQAAREFPALACPGNGDDVEIGTLRIAFRYESDLAEKFVGAVVVTFGLQDLQAVVVECATSG